MIAKYFICVTSLLLAGTCTICTMVDLPRGITMGFEVFSLLIMVISFCKYRIEFEFQRWVKSESVVEIAEWIDPISNNPVRQRVIGRFINLDPNGVPVPDVDGDVEPEVPGENFCG